ncbi:glycoside hydrolase family 88/105 protein [Alistipes sp.]|uniref:glycoside hydrolase family 88/105 protein n=1 Tax=Alistipes sp. TaxID=1872444 RepID=UPI003AF140D9
MKTFFTLCLFLLCSLPSRAVLPDEALLRRIADRVLSEYTLSYTDRGTGSIYRSVDEIPQGARVRLGCKYMDWHYSLGVLDRAMIRMTERFGDDRFAGFAERQIDYALAVYDRFGVTEGEDHEPFHFLRKFNELDHMGAQCAAMILLLERRPAKAAVYDPWIERAADHIRRIQLRFADGTLARTWPHRPTLWADDLYMGLSFMAIYASRYGDRKMLHDAVRQVRRFHRYLWNPAAELMYHGYYGDLKRPAGAHWGRCNGWVMLATCHLLDVLEPGSGEHKRVLALLERQISGIVKRQTASGLWRQLLDREDAWEESSSSAIFIYAIAHAVCEGWIDARYATAALRGWEGLRREKITLGGELRDVCVGTGIGDDMPFYYNRLRVDGETHGTGLVLEAGLEILRLKEKMNPKK